MPHCIRLGSYLSDDELHDRYRSAHDPVERSHWHFLWLLTGGATPTDVAAMTGWLWLPVSMPQRFALIAGLLLADAVLLFVVGALLAGSRGLLGPWATALVLALVAGAALTVIYYLFGGQFLMLGETSSSLPPYLNGTALLATVGLALAVYAFGWYWSRIR